MTPSLTYIAAVTVEQYILNGQWSEKACFKAYLLLVKDIPNMQMITDWSGLHFKV